MLTIKGLPDYIDVDADGSDTESVSDSVVSTPSPGIFGVPISLFYATTAFPSQICK